MLNFSSEQRIDMRRATPKEPNVGIRSEVKREKVRFGENSDNELVLSF